MIERNILEVKQRIKKICSDLAIEPESITVVAVSKNRSPEEIREVVKAGIVDIGENRLQEAVSKYKVLNDLSFIRWHMVGHLQRNKVKEAVRIFDLIHSLDSLRLAEEINRRAELIGKVQEVLIQVKTSPEPTKFGIEQDKVIDFIREILHFNNLKIRGLMTIAPYFDDPQKTRPFFRILRELKENIDRELLKLDFLSMGMSNDFEIAIQEGANMLRIGRLIFEGK
jgi:pyridoxal phosphate enzyme (YggS family)